MLYDDKVVQSGQITITPQILSDVFEIGLDYKSIGKTLEPIVPVEQGGPFQSCGYDMLGLKVRRALGLTLNGEQMAYRTPYNSMDKQVPLQKGKLTITNLGYDPFNRVSFEQNLPFPAEILNIVGELKVGTTWKEGIEPDATPAFSFIGSGNISDMFVINFIVNSARQDYVLYAELVAAGWNRISPVSCTFLLTPSGFLSASNQTGFAFDTGAPLPTGSIEPILTFQNVVQGCPGNGGAGGLGNQNGAPGFAGSDAMNVQYNITIDVSAGIIRSGSGGGGGGGGGYFGDSIESQGGSGGGGIAVPGLPGGLDAGAGGASGHDWAEAGSSGDPGVAGVGGAGGAPGKAIRLNGHTVHFVGDHDATHVIGAVS
jgi:hypothetical protein